MEISDAVMVFTACILIKSFADAVSAVIDIASAEHRDQWDRLVEMGISEEICACICMAHKVKIVPDRSREYLEMFQDVSTICRRLQVYLTDIRC